MNATPLQGLELVTDLYQSQYTDRQPENTPRVRVGLETELVIRFYAHAGKIQYIYLDFVS
jgi:hypothetical protein